MEDLNMLLYIVNKCIRNIELLILEKNIDFSKKTWGTEVSKIMLKTPQYCLGYIKKYLPHLIIK
jgi:hypothetical protein